jgi:hypothetical protein
LFGSAPIDETYASDDDAQGSVVVFNGSPLASADTFHLDSSNFLINSEGLVVVIPNTPGYDASAPYLVSLPIDGRSYVPVTCTTTGGVLSCSAKVSNVEFTHLAICGTGEHQFELSDDAGVRRNTGSCSTERINVIPVCPAL